MVSQSSLKVVIPAVMRLLTKDVGGILASDIVVRPDKQHSETSRKGHTTSSAVSTYFKDGEDVISSKHGVVVDIVPKKTCRFLSLVAESDSPQLPTKR